MVPGMWSGIVGLWPPLTELSDDSAHSHWCGLELDIEQDLPDQVLVDKVG